MTGHTTGFTTDLTFEQLFSALTATPVSTDEVAQLRAWLAGLDCTAECLALIEAAARGRGCPRCGCQRTHRCGMASGLQRFRCTACRRSYNALTGTPLARLRKRGLWMRYLQCLPDAHSVRKAGAMTGVHRTTSFRWRHRFVPGAARERPTCLTTVVEVDETYLLESQKGSRHLTRPARRRGGVASRSGINSEHDCLLIARDRSGQTLDFHTGRGPVTAAQLAACLMPVLPAGVQLISDGAAAYRRFASQCKVQHAWVNVRSGEYARGDIHIQNVNAWHARFKSWLIRFRGVASRYLIHYSGWQRVLDTGVLRTPAQWLVAAVQLG